MAGLDKIIGQIRQESEELCSQTVAAAQEEAEQLLQDFGENGWMDEEDCCLERLEERRSELEDRMAELENRERKM